MALYSDWLTFLCNDIYLKIPKGEDIFEKYSLNLLSEEYVDRIGIRIGLDLQPFRNYYRIKNSIKVIDYAKTVISLEDSTFIDKSIALEIVLVAAYAGKMGGGINMFLHELCGRHIAVDDYFIKNNKICVGMVCKLLGIRRKNPLADGFDCPRVWDLQLDMVVPNPNTTQIPQKIVAVTHRWGNNEITYDKIKDANVNISGKHDKLAIIRSELVQEFRYVWMDTLCIDKTSSSELDMSIRSMYRWYSSAWMVYLDSTTSLHEWSQRGWTLQEGCAAKCLGLSPTHGYTTFMELLANIEIDIYSLALERIYVRHDASEWLRLMDMRATTKIEDKVYSLIGLFGLDFQFAYGERERSVDRLHMELTTQHEDVSWLVAKSIRQDNAKKTVIQSTTTEILDLNMNNPTLHDIPTRPFSEAEFERIFGESTVYTNGVEVPAKKLGWKYRKYLKASYMYADYTALSWSTRSFLYLFGYAPNRAFYWIPTSNIIVFVHKQGKIFRYSPYWELHLADFGPSDWSMPTKERIKMHTAPGDDIDKNRLYGKSGVKIPTWLGSFLKWTGRKYGVEKLAHAVEIANPI